jgi:tRNA threonylcarbamoyladenosine biosynthesis protein TsaB
MKILAVDTATQSCSVAVSDNKMVLAEKTIQNGRTHSVHLLDMIDSVMEEAGLSVSELEGFAVTVGPGSFTGLRIGISTIKGLAMATKKPVVGISSLDVLANQCLQNDFLICPLIDARKKEVYHARYRYAEGRLDKMSPEASSSPVDAVKDIQTPCILVGSGARLYRKILKTELSQMAHFAEKGQNTIQASTVAFVSLDRFRAQKTDDVVQLVPHYIRKSDAELGFK